MTTDELIRFTTEGMRAAETRWRRTRADLFPELRGVPWYAIPEREIIEMPTFDTFKETTKWNTKSV